MKISTELGTVIIPETEKELPGKFGKTIYLDFETTGLHPYSGDVSCGFAVTFDDNPICWYLPYRHNKTDKNLDYSKVHRWLAEAFSNARVWINQNVKFDAHFAFQEGYSIDHLDLVDTIIAAKIHYSDRFSYNLKPLCREWLGLNLPEEREVKAYLQSIGSENYADVPVDILGPYAAMDVFGVRKLLEFCNEKRPEQCRRVWETEIKCTRVFFEMEKRGVKIDKEKTKLKTLRTLRSSIVLSDKLKELLGFEYSDSAKCNFEVLCGMYDLPILEYNTQKDPLTGKYRKTGPCFDKKVMKRYQAHPMVLDNPTLKEIIDTITEYREDTGFLSRYLNPYLELCDDNDVLHPNYNQLVRTGRTSCSDPNLQAVSPAGRELIVPREGLEFVSIDASQVEFRIIVHYLRDAECIRQYKEDPNTDFHQWVASICADIGLNRSNAKTMNFAIGYGAGKRKVTQMLAENPQIMDEISRQILAENIPIEKREDEFQRRCQERALLLYATYHERLPVKVVAKRATKSAIERGYVFNLHGRRRHLEEKAAHKALNSVVQGEAGDFVKERMVAFSESDLSKRFTMLINVHDELLFEAEPGEPREELLNLLESPDVEYRVPMKWEAGISAENWRIAAGK